jgi:hypothetical protein
MNRYPSPWRNTGWTYNAGVWSPNPVLAVDTLNANPNFDADTDWSKGASWTISAVTGKASHDGVSGLNNISQNVLTAGQWYRSDWEITDGAALWRIIFGTNANQGPNRTGAGVYVDTRRADGATFGIRSTTAGSATSCGVKLLSLTYLINIRNYGRQVGIAAPVTFAAGLQGGVVTRLSINPDGTHNFLHAWHDGTNAHLDTVVNDVTVVPKVSAAAAYGAAYAPRVAFPAPDTAQLLYGPLGSEVQVGADQDVSALPAGTWAGLFGTNSGVSIGNPVVT